MFPKRGYPVRYFPVNYLPDYRTAEIFISSLAAAMFSATVNLSISINASSQACAVFKAEAILRLVNVIMLSSNVSAQLSSRLYLSTNEAQTGMITRY